MNPLAKWLMIGGGLGVLIGPGAGVLITALSMTHAFAALGDAGVAEPGQLAAPIGNALIFTLLGFGMGILGALAFAAGLIVWLVSRSAQPPVPPAVIPQ